MYYDVVNTQILRDFKEINTATQYWGSLEFTIQNYTLKILFNKILEKIKYYTKKEIIDLFNLLQESSIQRRLIHVFMCFVSSQAYEMHSFEKYHAIMSIL